MPSYACPACGSRCRIAAAPAKRLVRCPACGQPFRLPGPRVKATGADDEEDVTPVADYAQARALLDEPLPAGSRSHVGFLLGLFALLSAAFALPLHWVPQATAWTVPVSGLSLALGLLGLTVALALRARGLGLALAGTVAGIVLFTFALLVWFGLVVLHDEAEPALAVGEPVVPVPAEAVPPPPAPAAKPVEGPWHDVRRGPFQVGDVRVTVGMAEIRLVELNEITGRELTAEPHLTIPIRIENLGAARKIDYPGWSTTAPTLTDDHGNSYRQPVLFNPLIGTTVGEQIRGLTSIRPGEAVTDLLVFERPVPRFSHLKLELSAAALGGTGTFRFLIPREWVRP